ncbi:leucine rich repeat family protein [Anaeramoeba flamelloides]|uniref:Leucine rich repeat family protein n=1 Tax=Anaeramoeba flamelloides TaxID=1746091 RepID=A0AAV7Y9T1_9EUKA|nr:leucine rich repeat family protein [Anaeramoeba flamelloides]
MSFCSFIISNLNSTYLSLYDQRFEKEELHNFFQILLLNEKIIKLDLSNKNLDDHDLFALCRSLEKREKPLVYLNLSNNQITDHGALTLNNLILKYPKKVSSIDLTDNKINNYGAIRLLYSFFYNKNINAINLSLNDCSSEIAGKFQKLTVMRLHQNSILKSKLKHKTQKTIKTTKTKEKMKTKEKKETKETNKSNKSFDKKKLDLNQKKTLVWDVKKDKEQEKTIFFQKNGYLKNQKEKDLYGTNSGLFQNKESTQSFNVKTVVQKKRNHSWENEIDLSCLKVGQNKKVHLARRLSSSEIGKIGVLNSKIDEEHQSSSLTSMAEQQEEMQKEVKSKEESGSESGSELESCFGVDPKFKLKLKVKLKSTAETKTPKKAKTEPQPKIETFYDKDKDKERNKTNTASLTIEKHNIKHVKFKVKQLKNLMKLIMCTNKTDLNGSMEALHKYRKEKWENERNEATKLRKERERLTLENKQNSIKVQQLKQTLNLLKKQMSYSHDTLSDLLKQALDLKKCIHEANN